MPTDEHLDAFAKKAFNQRFADLSADNRMKVMALAIQAEQAASLFQLADIANGWWHRNF